MEFSRQAAQPLLAGLALSVLVYIGFRLFRLAWPTEARRYPLPPGPPGRFIVGNLGQLNLDRPEEDYIRWGKEYGSSTEQSILLLLVETGREKLTGCVACKIPT